MLEASPFWEMAEELLAFGELRDLRAVGRCAERLRDGPRRLRAVYDVLPCHLHNSTPRQFLDLQARSVAALTKSELAHFSQKCSPMFLEVSTEASVTASFERTWLAALRLIIYARWPNFLEHPVRFFTGGRLEIVDQDLGDRGFVLGLVRLSPEAVRHVRGELISDPEVVLTALSVDGTAVKYVGELHRDLFAKALTVVPDVDEFIETYSSLFGFPYEDLPEVGLWLLKRGVDVSELHPSLFEDMRFLAGALALGGHEAAAVFSHALL
jgi:hypothetical protein